MLLVLPHDQVETLISSCKIPQMNYFLIPGNPPAAYFYELWNKEIVAIQAGAKAVVSHYPRLQTTSDSEEAMAKVLKAHREQLLSFHKKAAGPITIIGHSLGGHFALKLLHELHDEIDGPIQKVILLHPFLRKPETNGQIILKAVAKFYERERLQRLIIKNRRYLEYLSDELPFVTDEEIEKSFHLAHHESCIIATDSSPLIISQELRAKVSVFYRPKDIWCSPEVIANLKGQVPLFECTEPHSFVTKERHRRSLFAKILYAKHD